jgi:hypothetical protein
MVTDFLGVMLQEMGTNLEIPDLHPDRNNTCQIRLKSGLDIQIELDKSGQFIVLGADLGTVPPGKYRENLFREALKANDMPYPNHGTLAYSKKSDHLVLFERMNIKDLNGEKVAVEITPFSEKALIWKDALQRGDIPPLNQSYMAQSSGGMFGLRP